MEIDIECDEFIPQEYLDSDQEEDFTSIEVDSCALYQKMTQKAYSIKGMRRLNYLFKQRRREAIQLRKPSEASYSSPNFGYNSDSLSIKPKFVLNDQYMMLCEEYLKKIERLYQKNVEFLTSKLQGVNQAKLNEMMGKVDKDYYQIKALGRRMETPKELDF